MKFAVFFIASTLAAQQYFPTGGGDRFPADWYSKHLRALKEPSLWELSKKDPTAEVYRFLYLRTFHQPIAVRITVAGPAGRLVAKKASGQGGYAPGHLVYKRESVIPEIQAVVLGAIDESHFWDLPTEKEPPEIRPDGTVEIGVDGAQWIVEGVKNGKYHVIDRWSPDDHDPAHRIGILFMIELAHIHLLYEDVY